MQQFFNDIAFTLFGHSFTWKELALFGLVLVVGSIIYYFLTIKLLKKYLALKAVSTENCKQLIRIVKWLSLFVIIFLGLKIFHFEDSAINTKFHIILIIEILFLMQSARLLDWYISNIYIHKYYTNRDIVDDSKPDRLSTSSESNAARIVQYIIYIFTAIFVLQSNNLDIELYNFTSETGVDFSFKLSNILSAILVILFARLIIWVLTQIIFYSFYKRRGINIGSQFAINQLISYVIYTIAIINAFSILGLNMNFLLGGAAALLVGLGLGLQQTFNDFFSGIVLLFEKRVKIGNVLRLSNGIIGTVINIGLRSTIIETRDNISHIVPNSMLVNKDVVNWSHFDEKVRFDLSVGVAYESDTQLVKDLLLEAVSSNPYVIKSPAPFVRFMGFDDSALSFLLYFYSTNFIIIEDVKSDIRFEIDRLFRENDVTIPFPQRDIWIRNNTE